VDAEREVRIAKVQLKVIRILARVKPHLRAAVLELAAEKAGVKVEVRVP
jgi:hypothetical protein